MYRNETIHGSNTKPNKTANDTAAWWWWCDDKMKIDTFNRPKNDNFRFLYIVCCLVFRPDIAADHRREKKKSPDRICDCYTHTYIVRISRNRIRSMWKLFGFVFFVAVVDVVILVVVETCEFPMKYRHIPMLFGYFLFISSLQFVNNSEQFSVFFFFASCSLHDLWNIFALLLYFARFLGVHQQVHSHRVSSCTSAVIIIVCCFFRGCHFFYSVWWHSKCIIPNEFVWIPFVYFFYFFLSLLVWWINTLKLYHNFVF